MIVKSGILMGGGGVSSISVPSSNTSTASTISLPAGILQGDVIIVTAFGGGTVPPAQGTPTNFTNIFYKNTLNNSGQADIKLADGSESGSITGMNANVNNWKSLIIVRGDRPIKGYTVSSVNSEATSGNPVLQTVTSGSGVPPLIVVGVYGANAAVSPRTFSTTADAEISPATNHYLAYKVYNTSPANTNVDQDDEGVNVLGSFYVSFY